MESGTAQTPAFKLGQGLELTVKEMAFMRRGEHTPQSVPAKAENHHHGEIQGTLRELLSNLEVTSQDYFWSEPNYFRPIQTHEDALEASSQWAQTKALSPSDDQHDKEPTDRHHKALSQLLSHNRDLGLRHTRGPTPGLTMRYSLSSALDRDPKYCWDGAHVMMYMSLSKFKVTFGNAPQ
jgi:hypothetical protein